MDKIIEGYKQEIDYQNHMIDNLRRWLTLSVMIAAIGIVIICFFPITNNLFLGIIGWILFIVGLIAMMIFGYGIYKGRKNVGLVIEDLDHRLHNKD